MATISAFSCLHSISFAPTIPSPSPSLALRSFHSHSGIVPTSISKVVALQGQRSKNSKLGVVKAVEEETQILEQQEQEAVTSRQEEASTSEQQPVVVPISPSDSLTMLFQAEGTINELAIPALTKVLEETEGVGDLKVQIVEGIATVELRKQTTVQATGVASGLVETIQSSGFKLQTLHLSFDDEEVAAA